MGAGDSRSVGARARRAVGALAVGRPVLRRCCCRGRGGPGSSSRWSAWSGGRCRLSARHDTIGGERTGPWMHLVLGEEGLLVERAVAAVLRAARKQAGSDDVPVNRLRAGEVSTAELAELLSPSLFADERVVVLEAAAEAGKDAVALIETRPPICPRARADRRALRRRAREGAGRALKELGAKVHPCASIAKAPERADFVAGSSARRRSGCPKTVSRRCSTPWVPTSANSRRPARSWSPTPTARSTSPRCAATTAARQR